MSSPYSRVYLKNFYRSQKYLGKENLIDDDELFDDTDIKLDKIYIMLVKKMNRY